MKAAGGMVPIARPVVASQILEDVLTLATQGQVGGILLPSPCVQEFRAGIKEPLEGEELQYLHCEL